MKKLTDNIRNWMRTIRTYMEEDPLASIAILCAYIGDETAYEFFCETIPKTKAALYTSVGEAMRYDDDVYTAAEICGVLTEAVPKFIETSLDDFGLWFHLLDGTICILSRERIAAYLPTRTRYIAHGLLTLWKAKQLDEDNWYINFADLMAAYATCF